MSDAIYKIREQTIKEIADAIRAKAGKNDLISPLDMAEEILMLQAGNVDFSQQTATEDNVEEGYTFYNKYGLLSTGTGAGLNFKIVGGTTQPASPKENTIWVNTDLEITGWGFDTEPADYLTTGGVWIKTGTNGNVELNALKKNGICIYPQSCMQWDGTKYVSKDVKVYKNGEWLALKIWFLQGGEQYRDATGGWAVIDTPNGAHQPATIDGDGITFLTTAHTYQEIATVSPVDFTNINTLYFSVPRISLSGGDYRRFSMGINSTRTHKLVNNNEAEGWLVEKFIQNPQPAANLLYSLDTSSVNTECYILAVTGCGGGTTLTVVINEIYGV